MSTRALAVVSAGLSVPSSTRLLADRLTAATVDFLRRRGIDTTVEIVELREHARDLADNLVTGFANRGPARIERAADELADLVAQRPRETAADPFANPIPFETLLRGA